MLMHIIVYTMYVIYISSIIVETSHFTIFVPPIILELIYLMWNELCIGGDKTYQTSPVKYNHYMFNYNCMSTIFVINK